MASKYRKRRVIQSILIKKKYVATRREASALVKQAGGHIRDFDEDENFWRYRQHEPELFQKATFRHWHLAHGIDAIVALPIPGVFSGEEVVSGSRYGSRTDHGIAEYYVEAYDGDGHVIWDGIILAATQKEATKEARKHVPKGCCSFSTERRE